jgi:MFS transporter, DHA1 family, tetracycline resistance protein
VRRPKASVPFVLVCVFIDVLGFGLIIPVLPTLIGQFTDSREMQAHWYGILAASYGLTQFLSAPMLGALSDRFGRRPVLLLSILGLGCDFLLVAFAPSLMVILIARLIGGATASSFSVSAAYVADVTPPETRSKNMGLIGAAFGLGFIVGPAMGGLLGNANPRLPYFVAAGLSFLNFCYGAIVLPESLPRAMRSPFSWARANPFSAIINIARIRAVGPLVAVITLVNLASFILRSTWVLYTSFRFGWTPRDNGIALSAVGICAVVVQGGLMGPILKKLGEVRSVLIGTASGAVAYFLFGMVRHGWMLYPIVFADFMSNVTNPALQGLISRNVDAKEQGVTMGAINGIASVMLVIAPLIGTIAIGAVASLPSDNFWVGSSFYLSGLLQFGALMVAWRFFSRRRSSAAISSSSHA